jgi:hypothetical protein
MAAAMGLTQCRGVNDPVVAVDTRDNSTFGSEKESRCVHQCSRRYRRCRHAEQHRHERALRACRQLKDDERRECRKAEEDLHKSMIDECRDARRACRRECRYDEGSGRGGR